MEKARKASWEDYKEKIDSIEEMNKFRKNIERHLNIQMGTLEKPDGSITDPGIDTLDHLTSIHFAQATKLKKTTFTNKLIMKTDVEDWKPDWISEAKLNLAIHQFKNKKSPGPDGLRPLFFLKKPAYLPTYLPTCLPACVHTSQGVPGELFVDHGNGLAGNTHTDRVHGPTGPAESQMRTSHKSSIP